MAATYKLWNTVKSPKKAAKVLKFIDEYDECDYDVAEVRPRRSHHCALHAKHISLPPIAGGCAKAIYDAGGSVFNGPYVPTELHEAPVKPA